MTIYYMIKDEADSIDRATLQYPCKIVDIENREEYYFMNAEGDKIVTADVSKEVPELVTHSALWGKGHDVGLGISVSETTIELITYNFKDGSFEVVEVLNTVGLSSPLDFTGVAGFFAYDTHLGIFSVSDGKPEPIGGEIGPIINRAIQKLWVFFGKAYIGPSLVSPAGLIVGDFIYENDTLQEIKFRGTIMPMVDSNPDREGTVLVKIRDGEDVHTPVGDLVPCIRFAWKHPKVGDSDVTFE